MVPNKQDKLLVHARIGLSPIEKTGKTPIYSKQRNQYDISYVNVKPFFYVKVFKQKGAKL